MLKSFYRSKMNKGKGSTIAFYKDFVHFKEDNIVLKGQK